MLNARRSGEGRLTAKRAYVAALRVCREAGRLASSATHPDEMLLAACAEYGRLRRRIDRLSDNRARVDDLDDQSRVYADLTDAGRLPLASALSTRATTLEGHRARAALFLAWDEGDLIGRARRDEILEDRLLAVLLIDLVTGASS